MKITVVAQDLIVPDDDTLPPLSPLHHLEGHCQTSIGTSHIETTTTTHTETKVRTTTTHSETKVRTTDTYTETKVRTTVTHTETKVRL